MGKWFSGSGVMAGLALALGAWVTGSDLGSWEIPLGVVAGALAVGAVATGVIGVASLADHLRTKRAARSDISIRPLDPVLIDGWPVPTLRNWRSREGRAFRLSVLVENRGETRELEAVALPGMVGYGIESVYGDFALQWDVHDEATKVIPGGRSWKLHIAAAGGASAAFLGPQRLHYHYRELVAFRQLCFSIEIRDVVDDTRWLFDLMMGFEEDSRRPWLRLRQPGECDEWSAFLERDRAARAADAES